MKRLIRLMLAAILILVGLRAFSVLPSDGTEYVSQKYDSWSGVLQACVCSRWQAGGSFIRWLNRCAEAFEKHHDGVFIEFIECSENDLPGIFEICEPEMFFFSPGVITDASMASRTEIVCMGGYALAVNPGMASGGIFLRTDDAGHCFSAATIALLSGDTDAPIEPDGTLDIGISANSSSDLAKFINGEVGSMAICTAELAYLQRLTDSGRGFDWEIACPTGRAFTDQLLYLMIPTGLPDDGRSEILSEFADFLLGEDCQSRLKDIGAIPVSGSVYAADSPYAKIEAWLKFDKVIMPEIFSEYSSDDAAEIVRVFMEGELDAEAAIRQILNARY